MQLGLASCSNGIDAFLVHLSGMQAGSASCVKGLADM